MRMIDKIAANYAGKMGVGVQACHIRLPSTALAPRRCASVEEVATTLEDVGVSPRAAREAAPLLLRAATLSAWADEMIDLAGPSPAPGSLGAARLVGAAEWEAAARDMYGRAVGSLGEHYSPRLSVPVGSWS